MMKKNELSLGYRLNNPFNIRYQPNNKWVGQAKPVQGFCCFKSLFYGVRAFALLYRTYINKYRFTVQQFVYRYAPTSENNSQAYLRTVCRLSGFGPYHRLISADLVRFGSAVLQVEQGSVHIDILVLLKRFALSAVAEQATAVKKVKPTERSEDGLPSSFPRERKKAPAAQP